MSKKYITIIISLSVLFVAFLGVLLVVVLNDLNPLTIDQTFLNWAISIRGEKGDATYWFFRIITEFGYTYFVIFIILLMGILWKFKPKTWFFCGTILASWLLQKLVKFIIGRPRPDSSFWWMMESSSSFPSGHAITVACVFVLLCWFVCTSTNVKKWAKWLVCSIAAALMILVPLSRIILSVHYFSDVIAGLLFGSFVAVFGILFYNIFLDCQNKKQANADLKSEVKNQHMENINNKQNIEFKK